MISSIALSTFITLGGWSVHGEKYYDDNIKYNGDHKAFIVDYKGYTLGRFKNSYKKTSYVAGYTFRAKSLYARIGISSGYEKHPYSCIDTIKEGCLIFNFGAKYKFIDIGVMGAALVTSITFEI